MAARPDVPLGIIMLAIMGFLAGQMLYKWKMDLIVVTAIVVLVTVAAMVLGPVGATTNANGGIDWKGPINSATVAFNGAINKITGGNALMTVTDPTNADPRVPAPGADGTRPTTAVYDAATGAIKTMPAYLFWALFLLAFAFLSATLPIWRFAQPVHEIGFWITVLTMGLSTVGAILAPFIKPDIGAFALEAVTPLPGLLWQAKLGSPSGPCCL
jgi:hypothetical protein